METTADNLEDLRSSSKRVAGRFVAIAENRLELLMLELQEERERLLHVLLLALGAAVLGLLAGVALTVAIILLFWEQSPIAAALILTLLYAIGAIGLCLSCRRLQQDWQTLSGTVEQLRKDRECLERNLA